MTHFAAQCRWCKASEFNEWKNGLSLWYWASFHRRAIGEERMTLLGARRQIPLQDTDQGHDKTHCFLISTLHL